MPSDICSLQLQAELKKAEAALKRSKTKDIIRFWVLWRDRY